MTNKIRGEIEAEFNGASYRLCLTLGALAELEHAFGAQDLVDLAERFQRERLSAKDLIKILGAGLRGAGLDISDKEVSTLSHRKGLAGFAEVAVQLVRAAFGDGESAPNPPGP